MPESISTFLTAHLADFSDITVSYLSELGQCQVVFPQRLPIMLSFADGSASTWLLSSVISPMPASDCQRWLTDLLAANCCLVATDGATLGLDVAHDTIVLARQLAPATKTPNELYQMFTSFAFVADHWRRRLATSFLPEGFFGDPASSELKA